MSRLTKYIDGKAVCCNDISDVDELHAVIDKLAAYEDTGLEPNEIKKKPEAFEIEVKAKVYVLSRSTVYSKFDVIPATVTTISGKGELMRFRVVGQWKSGSKYTAMFGNNSKNKLVFADEVSAKQRCEELNKNI